jgi:hypothetical protein
MRRLTSTVGACSQWQYSGRGLLSRPFDVTARSVEVGGDRSARRVPCAAAAAVAAAATDNPFAC